jgi:hypothetical protein
MKPKIKSLWLQALRSGDYQQGRSYLRTGDGFCCLGVLCDLAVKAGVTSWDAPRGPRPEEWVRTNAPDSIQGIEGHIGLLPPTVQKWAGLEGTDSPRVFPNGSHGPVALSRLNDELRYDFTRIADLVEAQL